ncbi:hypothetical protein CYMTET_5759 [Cymbomonas tetramitiformis]|uniref:Transcription factor Pcc1 n=1 Tax=Cymbomonas tetramitiformis TaxID=36881 RepID=A0AAE0GYE8_9CHLO|nr:hypothetical protein CYMTET_5759 [Cymbomonas tetramitiformis]
MDFEYSMQAEYASHAHAQMIMTTLDVDAELNQGKVSRTLHVQDSTLHARFAATEARLLRAAVSSFLDLMTLATKTLEQFEYAAE